MITETETQETVEWWLTFGGWIPEATYRSPNYRHPEFGFVYHGGFLSFANKKELGIPKIPYKHHDSRECTKAPDT